MKPVWLGNNNTALAIIRVSSKRQEGNISHELQEAEVRAYCERNRLKLTDVVRIVESAKDSDDRKKYALAVATALAQEVRHLLFYMFDRESRNLTDNEKNEKLVKSDLIVLHYVRDQKVLHRDSSDADFFIRDVQAAANKQFIRNLTAKVSDAMRQKAEQGWYPSNNPPLGYVNLPVCGPDGKPLKRGTVIGVDPDPKRVGMVLREFQLRAAGHSYQQIRDKIVAEGFLDPVRAAAYRASAVEYRLSNPFYWGRFVWQGVEYDGKHPLIIPRQHLDATRALRRGLRLVSRATYADGHGVLAGSWMKCKACGCAITYDPKRKTNSRTGKVTTYHYYRCRNSKREHASLAGMNILESTLFEQLGRAVDAIQLPEAFAAELARALNDGHVRATQEAARDITKLRADLKALEAKEDRAYDDMYAGVVDPEGYRRVIQRLRGEKTRVQRAIEDAQGQFSGGYRETAQSVVELCKRAKELYLSRSPIERRMFLEKVLSNPVLNGVTVEYELKKPFSTLAEMNESGEWRTRLGEFRTGCAALQGGIDLGKSDFVEGAPSGA